ncbi:hypothetical protein EUTSA_v10019504mg, partial [Eutrema salsugineum]
PILTDLIIEIFSRLPAKSVARFRTLSKQWGSILRSPDFADLFLSRSSSRPRLLFAVERGGEWLFFSSPQPKNPYDESVTVDYHTKFSGDESSYPCNYSSGLIYFPAMWLSRDFEASPVICNPITGMYERLPNPVRYYRERGFLGFDSIEKKFKSGVICCPAYYRSLYEGICIDGALYYLAMSAEWSFVIIRFDLRSEEFKHIDAGCFNGHSNRLVLINYKGKLGGVNWKYGQAGCGRRTVELSMWVLEKQGWLKHAYTLPENEELGSCEFSVAGMTARGEIVLCMKYTCNSFYVFYFNPERNTLQSVEIQGFGANLEAPENCGTVHAFVDHFEDLSVNDAVQLKSSVSLVKHTCRCCDTVLHPNYHFEKRNEKETQ